MEMKCHFRVQQRQVAHVENLQLGLQGKCSESEGDRQGVLFWVGGSWCEACLVYVCALNLLYTIFLCS